MASMPDDDVTTVSRTLPAGSTITATSTVSARLITPTKFLGQPKEPGLRIIDKPMGGKAGSVESSALGAAELTFSRAPVPPGSEAEALSSPAASSLCAGGPDSAAVAAREETSSSTWGGAGTAGTGRVPCGAVRTGVNVAATSTSPTSASEAEGASAGVAG